MKYTFTNDDKTVYFPNNKEFIRWMRNNDKLYFDTNKEFMEAYSYRQYFEDKTILRFDNENNFVADLISEGLLLKEGKPSEWENFKEKIISLIKNPFISC